MILTDQPTIFPDTVRVAVSCVDDGSMKDGVDLLTAEAIRNRQKFLESLAMQSDQAAVFYADFATEDFCNYAEARPGLMPGCDGVSTDRANQPILLPVADCVAAVLYDPAHHAVMVSHLGRHSTQQHGGQRSVENMTKWYGSKPNDLLVWLGPSSNGTDYPLHAFGDRSFAEVLIEQFENAGVNTATIQTSHVDTSTNPHYFSHSQFLKGQQTTDGRYAVAVMIT